MTKKERIAELERELADVKRRLDVLEQRRVIFWPAEPYVAPSPEPFYVQPQKCPYRDTTGDRWWERQPQTSDPLPEPNITTVCGAST